MSADWLVEPKVGIGRLEFGLSPDEVAALADGYGSPGPLMKPVGAADLDAMFRNMPAMAEYVSEEDIAALRQAMGEQEDVDRQTLEMNETPILLEYRSGRLHGVTVEARHIETQFANARIFAMAASDVLRIFQRANGGQAVIVPTRRPSTTSRCPSTRSAMSLKRAKFRLRRGMIRTSTHVR